MIMKYQKLINLLDNTPNQPTKFRTESWVEISDDVHGYIPCTYSLIKFNVKNQVYVFIVIRTYL